MVKARVNGLLSLLTRGDNKRADNKERSDNLVVHPLAPLHPASGTAASSGSALSVNGSSALTADGDDNVSSQAAVLSQEASEVKVNCQVGLLQGKRAAEFRPHRLVVTAEVLVLRAIDASAETNRVVENSRDVIRLTDVDKLEDISTHSRQEGTWEWPGGVLMIHTKINGRNAGRKYCLCIDADRFDGDRFSAQLSFAELQAQLRTLVAQAQLAALEQTCKAKFHRCRLLVKSKFRSVAAQIVVSLLIFSNFLANAFEAQYKSALTYDDGRPTSAGEILINLDEFYKWYVTTSVTYVCMYVCMHAKHHRPEGWVSQLCQSC